MLRLPQIDALNKPYKIFTDYVEHEATRQFINVMSRPDTIKGALMPDVHAGYTLPIGGVVLSKDRLYPEYVGVDIGCGMVSVELNNLPDMDASLMSQLIKQAVPVGFNVHKQPQTYSVMHKAPDQIKDLVDGAVLQMGTLGGGNHFIEIGKGQKGDTFVTIHSGSRGLGKKVADRYMALSKNEGFVKGSDLYKEYMDAMTFVCEWAYFNRMTMIKLISEVLGCTLGVTVSCVHNFAKETEEGVIHYKGANNLPEGIKGIIPANMRDGVYVVKGRGNEEAMDSVSHGAGRIMSRSAAKKKFSIEQFQQMMSEKDRAAFPVDLARIDECPEAYKPIDIVMENQKELCSIVDIIRPILNVKG